MSSPDADIVDLEIVDPEADAIVSRFAAIRERIEKAARDANRQSDEVTLVAVTKTFEAPAIVPVLEAGQRVFAENRVQEAQQKWPALREVYRDVELRLIGPLQSNKAAEAVALFDVIETVDREKIARALARETQRQNRAPRFFVQVNTGLEPQKAGIEPADCVDFVARCRSGIGLAIEGLMCIPPFADRPEPHFTLLRKLARQAGVERLSMGMSADFETAIGQGASSVRIGSAIFGRR